MAMPGPQIGGISLLVHILVIVAFFIKHKLTLMSKFSSSLWQKIVHPSRPNAK